MLRDHGSFFNSSRNEITDFIDFIDLIDNTDNIDFIVWDHFGIVLGSSLSSLSSLMFLHLNSNSL